ncbi:C6 zinc finger domain protein [Cordyceps fumosorosea ARSEF 2679]|uniref:C6 zinc finger domain protein n=1 Tax=Cordyceps fumosorosea (strain ARSEF 2679) TaxID=1081104 RepID=A0A162KCH3_CORFA|nr:C6 zinc finger domain protein [Cordyceps fumosorosea ARSEF 2679]OAA57186.1 C6 zinc finger domain protein [Cordyceps fumosorosea ARSEF 2679]
MKLRSTSRVCGAWMDKVLELDATGDEGKALRDAIEAFGVAIVSQTAPEVASAADALDAHGTALSSIHRALRRCQTSRPNELSSAMMFLFLSEFLLPSASSARFHAFGLSQLMVGQGPNYYSRGLPHELFLGFRTGMIVWSIAAHKAIFLGSPEWSTIPFQERPAEPLQALVTVGARIPSILETIDKMNESIDPEKAWECLDLLKDVMNSLGDWKSLHSAGTLLQQGGDLDDESVSMHDILYHDVTEANSVMHYLTFRIICAVHARSLHEKLADAQPLPIELAIPESTLTENAASIMQSVGYLTQEQMRLYGGMSALLPFKVSHEYLERYGGPDHQALCKRVVDDIKARRHFYLINFLLSDSILGTYSRGK